METFQSHPGFYPRGRREGQSLISLLLQRVCHILPVKETPPRRLDGAVHSTDGLLYGRADEGVALPADGGHCRDTQVEHQQAQIIQDLFRVHALCSGWVCISNRARVSNKEVGVIPNTSPAHLLLFTVMHKDAQRPVMR